MPLLFIVALRLFLALAEEFYDATPLALERSSKGIRPRRRRDGTAPGQVAGSCPGTS